MFSLIRLLAITASIFILLISCNGGEMTQEKTRFPGIKDIPASAWEKLSHKKVYFAHQSVGFNIIDGIKEIMSADRAIKMNIRETTAESDFDGGVFAHSKVGRNTDPKSKIVDFIRFIDNGIGENADFAALKFCYVDIRENSDVHDIFKEYKTSFERVRAEFPGMTIIHFTSPLTTIQTGPKVWVKKLIGRAIGGTDDNAKRGEYNDLLLKEYEGKEPVFDLARIESTYPDGSRCTFTIDGKTYYSLVPEFTHDGGHLNEKGRKIVAEHLLIFLANVASKGQ